MDLVESLRKRISELQPGLYTPGLRAVLLHIETAFKHLARGQSAADDTAFTDVIYRTNQAFEGSIKEAYRVLAGKDPARKRPAEIEEYLERERVFRARVLAQFTNYRQEWRNPSAHDYQLDFDESEAFLAIVSVTAFAILVIDQIEERVAFTRAVAETTSAPESAARPKMNVRADLLTYTSDALKFYCENLADAQPHRSEAQVIGSIHGFLTTVFPNAELMTDGSSPRAPQTSTWRPDLLMRAGNETIIIEVKRRYPKSGYEHTLDQLIAFMREGQLENAVLLYLPEQADSEMDVIPVATEEARVRVLVPKPNRKVS